MTEPVQVPADAVHVRLTRRATPAHDPCSAFLALRELLGADEVFLLESLAGPTADRRAAVVGFRPLLEFQVRECAVELHGIPALVDRARAALLVSGTVVERDDSLWLSSVDTMWDAARALQNLFVVPEGKADRFSFGFLAFFGYDVVHYIEEIPQGSVRPPGGGSGRHREPCGAGLDLRDRCRRGRERRTLVIINTLL
jgi:anthranilate synthase component I